MATVISRDSMRLESPAAQEELKYLKTLKAGDVRTGVLLPALEVGMEWTLVLETSGNRWEFDGTFFGQPLYHLVIRTDAAMLTLEVQEAR